MKKLLLVAAVAAFASVNAQMQKGTWVVGATSNLGFNSVNTSVKYSGNGVSETEDGPTVNTFTFNPSVGHFIIDNLAVGLDFGYVNVSTEEGGDKMIMNTVSVLPTGTYYFYNEGKVIPYLGAGIGYSAITAKEKYSGSTYSETYDGLTWKGKGGIVYLINKNIGIDLGLSYNQFTNKETEEYMGNTYTTKSRVGTLGANVGFTLFLGKTTKGNSVQTTN